MDMNDKGLAWLLNTLTVEIPNFDEKMFPVDKPIGKEETVIGEMTEYARKFYAYRQFLKREAARQVIELQYMHRDSPDLDRAMTQVQELNDRYEVVNKMFWLIIEEEAGHLVNQTLAVRDGWKIVRYDAPSCEAHLLPINPEQLRGLFGNLFGK